MIRSPKLIEPGPRPLLKDFPKGEYRLLRYAKAMNAFIDKMELERNDLKTSNTLSLSVIEYQGDKLKGKADRIEELSLENKKLRLQLSSTKEQLNLSKEVKAEGGIS